MNKTTTVGVEFRAYNRAQTGIASFERSLTKVTRSVVGLAGVYLGGRGLVAGVTSVARAAMEQEKAENALGAAVGGNIAQFKAYAAAIQKRTVYGDEAVLAEMAYGRNLGITTDKLQEATTAAVGLAAKYKLDLKSAMMLVGRASQGQTQMLTRYGIVLDETLTDTEKFDELLRLGASSFHLAEAATQDLAGRSKQLANRWGDLKESLGKPIAEVAISSLEALEKVLKASTQAAAHCVTTINDLSVASATNAHGFGLPMGMDLGFATRDRYNLGQQPFGPITAPTGPPAGAAAWDKAFVKYMKSMRGAWLTESDLRPGETLTSGVGSMKGPTLSEIDYDAYWEQFQKNLKGPGAAGRVMDESAALRAISGDLHRMSSDVIAARRELLETQYAGYKQALGDRPALATWKTEQDRQLLIDQFKGGDSWRGGFRAAAMESERDMQTLGQAGYEVANGWSDAFGDFFRSMRTDFDDIGALARNLADQLMAIVWEVAVVKPMTSAITQGLGAAMSSTTTNALGNVYGRSGLIPFARGGVVNGPTVFPFANGVGLMGEAGPEAIMPLTRGPSGKLGVEASGGAPNVAIQVVNNGQAKNATTSEPRWDGRQWVIGLILDDLDHGGPLCERLG